MLPKPARMSEPSWWARSSGPRPGHGVAAHKAGTEEGERG